MTQYRTWPLSLPFAASPWLTMLFLRYRIGDSFISLPLPEAQSMLSSSSERIDEEVSALEEKIGGIREEMQQLKVALYARFGRSINLET